MKKVLSSKKNLFLLIFVLIVPIFLLYGCGEMATYNITATSSYSQYGYVTGMGVYNEGSRVTLTARGINNHRFVAWVYQNKQIISPNDNAYTITTSDDNLTSTLSFNATSYTSDNYTAVFEDDSQMYYLPASVFMVEREVGGEIIEGTEENSVQICTGNLSIEIGENTLSYRNAVNLTNQTFTNVRTNFSDVRQVLKLSDYQSPIATPYHLRFTFSTENAQNVTKYVTLYYGESKVQDGVIITFNSNGDILLSCDVYSITETSSDGVESVSLVTLVITLSQLKISA